jgi:ABC-type branched-subunit amino acid transport system permease subunit
MLLGPVFGAGFLIGIEEFARGFTELNVIIIGVLFVLVVIYAPEGIYGKFKK